MNHMCVYMVLGFDGNVAILDDCPVCGSEADEIEGCCRPVDDRPFFMPMDLPEPEPAFADTEAAWEADEEAELERLDLL